MNTDIVNIDVFKDEVMYTDVIEPEIYNTILSKQHIYIAQADSACIEIIKERVNIAKQEIVELGCGPARILKQLTDLEKLASITGVDIDSNFLNFAKNVLSEQNSNINLVNANILDYKNPKPVDIFLTVGVHHHIAKGNKTKLYLENIYNQLSSDGIYILMDEFIPDYTSEQDRELRLAIWYSHVIAHALKYGYHYLANEEARIFLDDVLESKTNSAYKTNDQVNYILKIAPVINEHLLNKRMNEANDLAKDMLTFINQNFNLTPSNNVQLDLSRQDYKISYEKFKEEFELAGFKLKDKKIFGNLEYIGAMCVYVLSKK